MSADKNFENLNLEIPDAPKPLGVYKPLLVSGNYCYVSGHGPVRKNQPIIVGTVGMNMSKEEGKLAAQQTGLAIIATLIKHFGSLNKIHRVVKVFGMVGCTSDFGEHPYVINGCSELFAKIWGEENGIGVRSAVGMNSLPQNIPVEIEAVFELKTDALKND